jgi:hypothetical protein
MGRIGLFGCGYATWDGGYLDYVGVGVEDGWGGYSYYSLEIGFCGCGERD